ncbi:hypothetical protein MtrunA17_Chr4g0032151 [Medicago truncatula]|uniref:Uncharacterized protein n=1 Tax=Medicago truncatula TaxID=3880 RepID=A0A396I5W3_MEDTR|nr:hypothetical protein MtrunA17_Chr4g0032151 [Medicago truncatula]
MNNNFLFSIFFLNEAWRSLKVLHRPLQGFGIPWSFLYVKCSNMSIIMKGGV